MSDAPDITRPFSLVVDAAEHGERIDRWLAEKVPAISRATLQRWIAAERIRVDDQPCKASAKLVAGARVSVDPMPPPPSTAEPEDIPISVLFEDPHLLVIDKPAGIVVHPAPGHASGTLVNAVLHHVGAQQLPRSEIDGEENTDGRRPGIVHRLDKDTSGVLVIAKTQAAHRALVTIFQKHDIERVYLAIAVGVPPWETHTFSTLHGRHPTDRKRFTTKVREGRHAITHARVLARFDGAALLSCRLETGRTHQIRVHLTEARLPLLGDATYGNAPRDPTLKSVAQALGRQALHAAVLAFAHPITAEALRFESAPPADFQRALDALRRD